ncbi:Fatty acid-binding protein, brain [Merluccius polli]|uniref:Fatty acid-binding protein, brain n=1 Tax=Merluccius polli TaxID=89951 RepID=A0AA47NAM0_MERPO|nr:Fatty acid-binding protein, brain [Merluccius polli]
MVDAFCATWKLVDSENFDDYMKALGGQCDQTHGGHQPGWRRTGDQDAEHLQEHRDLFYTGQEFDEATADDRNCKTTVSLDGDKLIQVQKWDGKETKFVREIKDGKLVMNLTFEDIHAVRTYEKA